MTLNTKSVNTTYILIKKTRMVLRKNQKANIVPGSIRYTTVCIQVSQASEV
jgi:hypothetical protein